MKIKTVYLDMDGVLNDFSSSFIKEVMRAHDVTLRDTFDGYNVTEWFYMDLPLSDNNVNRVEFVKKVLSKKGYWENLPVNAELKSSIHKLITFCKDNDIDLRVCTKPWNYNENIEVKKRWLTTYFSELNIEKTVFIDEKHLLARDSALLIDDNPTFADEFFKAGGYTLLWDTFYNRCCSDHMTVCNIEEVITCIMEIDE